MLPAPLSLRPFARLSLLLPMLLAAAPLAACGGVGGSDQPPPPCMSNGESADGGTPACVTDTTPPPSPLPKGRVDATFADLGDAFLPYCTAVLLAPQPIATATGLQDWVDDGTLRAPAGTTVILTSSAQALGGVALLSDGTPASIDTGTHGLVAGVDFTSRCAPDEPAPDAIRWVLLRAATVYATPQAQGRACSLPVATGLDGMNYALDGASDTGQLSTEELPSLCGMKQGYVREIAFAPLLPY